MTKITNWSAGLAIYVITGTISLAALAQSAPSISYSSFDASSAKPVQIGDYAVARKDCTAAPPPTIRVIEAPKSGTLTVRRGVLTTSSVAGCPRMKTPVQVLFYQARVGATGADHLAYEVTNASGKVDAYDVTINIKEPPKSPVPDSEKPI